MLKRSRVLSVCFLLSAWALLTSADAYGQSAVLKELAQEDQAAQSGKKFARTDEERIKIVLGLIAQGALQVPADRFNAALVLQHTPLTFCRERLVSTSPDNYLLAHHLSPSLRECLRRRTQGGPVSGCRIHRSLPELHPGVSEIRDEPGQ